MASPERSDHTEVVIRPIADALSQGIVTVPDLQRVGHDAWSAQLSGRTEAEIKHVFDPSNPELVAHQDRVIKTLKKGEYIGAFVTLDNEASPSTLIGYAAIKQDVSGNPFKKALKRYMYRRPPYATVPSINVLPEYSRSGLGMCLMWRLSISKTVQEHMIPTAYVLEENESGMNFFSSLGYKKTPIIQETTPQIDYFGPDTTPPDMWRLAASNVASLHPRLIEGIERKDARILYYGQDGSMNVRIKRPS